MISKYTRTLKNGRQIEVFMSCDEFPDVFVVYMSDSPIKTIFPTVEKEIKGDVAHALTDFLEDESKLKAFEETDAVFAIKISKGEGMIL